MVGNQIDINKFLRESMEENERIARVFLLEERRRKIEELNFTNGLPSLFKDKTLANYDKTYNLKAYEAALAFVDKFPHTKGLLLSGDVGVGKTHLAAGIVNELNERLYNTYFGNILDIINFFKTTYNKNSLLTENDVINLITGKVDLLVIDDLGKENSTDNSLSLLYQVINKVYENEKPLVITTNYRAADLQRKLGERGQAILSRISAMCDPVILKGIDWRLDHGRPKDL